MSVDPQQRFPKVAVRWDFSEEEHRRTICQAMNGVMERGETNNLFRGSLAINATTTTITDVRVTSLSVPVWSPLSATAVGAVTWVEPTNGSLVIHHSSSTDATRIVGVLFFG